MTNNLVPGVVITLSKQPWLHVVKIKSNQICFNNVWQTHTKYWDNRENMRKVFGTNSKGRLKPTVTCRNFSLSFNQQLSIIWTSWLLRKHVHPWPQTDDDRGRAATYGPAAFPVAGISKLQGLMALLAAPTASRGGTTGCSHVLFQCHHPCNVWAFMEWDSAGHPEAESTTAG